MVFEFGGGEISEAALTAPSVVKGSDVIGGDELSRGTGGREAIAEASGLEGNWRERFGPGVRAGEDGRDFCRRRWREGVAQGVGRNLPGVGQPGQVRAARAGGERRAPRVAHHEGVIRSVEEAADLGLTAGRIGELIHGPERSRSGRDAPSVSGPW